MCEKRVYVGYVNGEFRAWVLCPTCHTRVYVAIHGTDPVPDEHQACSSCGATVDVPSYQRPSSKKWES